MTSNIRPLRRRLRLTRGRLINGGRMNKEKQELSFFLVLTFFVIFGIIYLAEVLFLEDSKVGFEAFYDESSASNNNNNDIWETPKPILPLNIGRSVSNAVQSQSSKSDKLAESLKRHQEEMERLIRNISLRISKPTSSPGPTPHQYEAEEFLDLNEQNLDAHWQPVNGTKHKFYVYSAYFDRRQKPVIRLIGATKTKKSDKVWCQLHFNESHTLTVPGGVTIIRENWNLKYSACFVLCTLPTVPDTKIQSVPKFVSIVSSDKEDTKATNKLPVLNADTGTGSQEVNGSAVGVCVKPMHFHYNKSLELLEFLELNKMLGVTKFTLYNDTVSEEVNCLLEHYIKEGSVVVLPWKLNIDSQTEIRTEGLFAALNDCLYRNMNDFRYLMLIDFDEFIVPHTNNTIPEMIQYVDSQKIVVTGQGRYGIKVPPNQPKITSAYSFQNAFFYLQFPDDSEGGLQTNLRVLRKTRKKSKFNPQKQRSKYICVPQNVKEAGNHFIWEFHRGSNLNVPTKFGFLHHYRVCEFGGDDCIHTESNVDRRMVHYREPLIANIQKVLHQLSSRCGLDSRLLRDLSSQPEKNNSSILTQSNTTTKNIVNNH